MPNPHFQSIYIIMACAYSIRRLFLFQDMQMLLPICGWLVGSLDLWDGTMSSRLLASVPF